MQKCADLHDSWYEVSIEPPTNFVSSHFCQSDPPKGSKEAVSKIPYNFLEVAKTCPQVEPVFFLGDNKKPKQ